MSLLSIQTDGVINDQNVFHYGLRSKPNISNNNNNNNNNNNRKK